MSKRENKLLVADIIQCFRLILKYTEGMNYEDFLNSQITCDAVVRNFEIIGEAAKISSPEFRSDNPKVPWRDFTDFRNKLIHHYFGVYWDIVWDVIQNEIPAYLDFLETIEEIEP